MSNSFYEKRCDGCQHITNNSLEWCYMFKDSPDDLPCSQHDKFKELRRENGKRLYKLLKGETK